LNVSGPRAVIQQQIVSTSLPDHPVSETETTPTNPNWLFLAFELCCLAGLLCALPTLIWSVPFLTLGDVNEYNQYALAFWTQTPLFHQFPQEYPPLALIPFAFTLTPFHSILYYWAFAFWMGVIFCLSYLWMALAVSHRKALIYALYLLVGAAATLLMRFDLLPALATLGALVMAERKHYSWAYTLLAIGVLLKLYPAFLVPVVMAAQWRDVQPGLVTPQEPLERESFGIVWQRSQPLLKGLSLFVALIAIGFGAPLALNFQQATSFFTYNLARPIQIESAPASLLWFGTLFGFPIQGEGSFGSVNLVGPLGAPLKMLSLAGLVGGSLLVYWRIWNGNLNLGQAFLATIGVVMVFNKVLSPQYFIWVLPLVAYVLGLDLFWLALCCLTTLIYPFLYHVYYHVAHEATNPMLLWAIAIRNVFLMVAVVRAVQGKAGWTGKARAPMREEKTVLRVL
jgi:hypothetical protein